MKIGSLFSGIGGLEKGLEGAGLGSVLWQVEIDPFCRRVLAKHWPHVERFEDVQKVGAACLRPVDVICGGFPCQDVSSAGKGAGVVPGTRSGLWLEYRRVVDELRPRWVVVENVASGAHLWLSLVRRQLCELGYGTAAVALSAADVGAPHIRERIFVVGDSHGDGESIGALNAKAFGLRGVAATPRPWPAPPGVRRVDDGLSRGLDGRRLKALGNAVVPQCSEVIGRMILASVGGAS